MTNSQQTAAPGKPAPPRMLSPASRSLIAAAVVVGTATSVWVADAVSRSPLPDMASATAASAPRMATALPTVTVVGRRASLEPAPRTVMPEGAPELSSLAAAEMPSGRVKLRQ
jgi:hypothetical protein